MIAVAGGTGRLGTLLVRRLVDRGSRVRVITREPDRARPLADLGVDIVQADVRDASRLSKAVAGAETVVSAIHGFAGPGHVSPASVDSAGNINLIDASRTAGSAFVLMSVVGAAPDSPMELFRAKFRAEQYLRQSEIPWTIVRATAFVELWADIIGDPLVAKGKTVVFGRGENPINFVSVADVAAVLDLVISQPAFRGHAIELGGPDIITFSQLASMLQELVPRPTSVRHIPRAMLRALSIVLAPTRSTFGRQVRAALAMDTLPMNFDAAATWRAFPGLTPTPVKAALARYAAERWHLADTHLAYAVRP